MINNIQTQPTSSFDFKLQAHQDSKNVPVGNDPNIGLITDHAVTKTNNTQTDSNADNNSNLKDRNPKEVIDNINKINYLLGSESFIRFESEDGFNVVKIVDTQTKETLRQIPTEQMIHFQKRIKEMVDNGDKDIKGFLLNDKA